MSCQGHAKQQDLVEFLKRMATWVGDSETSPSHCPENLTGGSADDIWGSGYSSGESRLAKFILENYLE